MKIKINPLLLSEANFDLQKQALKDYDKDVSLDKNILYEIYKSSILKLEDQFNIFLEQYHEEFNIIKNTYTNLNFPDQIEVNVYFSDKNYYNFCADYTNSNMHGSLGVSLFEGGQNFIRNEDSYFADSFNIIVSCDENEELNKFVFEVDDYNTKEDNILSIYNTLTHEIMHNILFIQMSGGLTPHAVSEAYDSSQFDFTPLDCSLATHIVLGDNFDYFKQEEWYEEMEFYVENMSRNITADISKHIFPFLSKIEVKEHSDKKSQTFSTRMKI